MANPWLTALAVLGGVGHGFDQNRQRALQEQIAAANLMKDQGQFMPVSPEDAMASGQQVNPLARLFGMAPPGQIQMGNQAFKFSPHEIMDMPGVGKIPMTPEMKMKIYLQRLEHEGDTAFNQNFFRARQPGVAASPVQMPDTGITESNVPSHQPSPQAGSALQRLSQDPRIGQYAPLIIQAAQQFGIDPFLLAAKIMPESGGNPQAVSPAGAQGLMQFMPETAQRYGVKDAFNPGQAIPGAANYIADLLKMFQGNVPKAIAGYNAGEGAVQKYGGVPPYDETQTYVKRVLSEMQRLRGGPSQAGTVSQGAPPKPPGLTGADLTLMGKIATIDEEIAELNQMGLNLRGGTKGTARAGMIEQRLNRLETQRTALEKDLNEPAQERRKLEATSGTRAAQKRLEFQATSDLEVDQAAKKGAIEKQQQLAFEAAKTPILAERSRMEGEATEAVRLRLAQAARELTPAEKGVTDKVDSLMKVKSAMATIKEILARRAEDPNFAKSLKKFTGPLQGIITQYFEQTLGSDDPDENDFVSALRTLQSEDIRVSAGLTQSPTETERAIGLTKGRLPTLFNPPAVFESRMKILDESINRSLQGQARNMSGREYGKFIQEFLDEQKSRGAAAASPPAQNDIDTLRRHQQQRGPAVGQ